jgi:ABC-type transport system involved in cytochrome c biogenesis ATPase subunit/GNAT superfamily N-acetyltransferase
MKVDINIESAIVQTPRIVQVSGAFDVPITERQHLEWKADLPIEDKPWNVGLIVGPSGAGKTTIMRHLWGEPEPIKWEAGAIVDDFRDDIDIDSIAAVCQAVGFNTIPAWMRPHHVLSNGEQFRVDLARRLIESHAGDVIVIDEFSSVVDRQVAKIAAHAAQKWIRKTADRQLVAVTCHYDVIDWLQPDWTFDPSTREFSWRSLQRRPGIPVEISPVRHDAWEMFSRFHYLTAELHRAARCFVLFAGESRTPAAFAGLVHRPISNRKPGQPKSVIGVSRIVTLPDWQGLGLAFVLLDALGSAYAARRLHMHGYPAHPALIRSMDRSPMWALTKRPSIESYRIGATSTAPTVWRQGTRPNATFRYVGPANEDAAQKLVDCKA